MTKLKRNKTKTEYTGVAFLAYPNWLTPGGEIVIVAPNMRMLKKCFKQIVTSWPPIDLTKCKPLKVKLMGRGK